MTPPAVLLLFLPDAREAVPGTSAVSAPLRAWPRNSTSGMTCSSDKIPWVCTVRCPRHLPLQQADGPLGMSNNTLAPRLAAGLLHADDIHLLALVAGATAAAAQSCRRAADATWADLCGLRCSMLIM